jgi:lycopene cyclase domain-containing protein
MSHYTYLALNLLSVAFPLAYSFTARSGFSRRFGPAWLAILLVAVPMLVWDVVFTARGVWGFNPEYHLGAKLYGLPVEEILFFFCIPFACLFIYDTVKKFPSLALPVIPVRAVSGALAVLLVGIAAMSTGRAYTFWCLLLAAPFPAALAAGYLRHRAGHIASAYLFHLIPFFLVNGILTALPVVWYNNAENLGLRLGTIPVEDAAYSLILLLGSVFIMEGTGNGKTSAPGSFRATR